MPHNVALLLCIGFVLFLLRLDRKEAPDVSHALWIPTVWMLYIASKPLGNWFAPYMQTEGGEVDSGSPIDRVFLSVLLCLGLIILGRRRFDWAGTLKDHPWLMLLMGYALMSILWSDIPLISFKRWIRELLAVIMAFLVLSERAPQEALQVVIRRATYILIPFSVLLIKYFPMYGVMYGRWTGDLMWVGVTCQKNGLGRLCLVAIFFLVWTFVRRWLGHDTTSRIKYRTCADIILIVTALDLLKGPPDAYSATAVASLAVGLTTLGALVWMNKRQTTILASKILVATIALVIGLGIITPLVGGGTVGSFSSVVGRDATLTGRTDIWAELLPIAMQHPILGAGFGGFWTAKSSEIHQVNESHNGYLEVLLDRGFVGLLLLSVFVLSFCRKACSALRHGYDGAIPVVCYVLMVVLHNVSESSIESFTTQLTAIMLVMVLSFRSAPQKGQVLGAVL